MTRPPEGGIVKNDIALKCITKKSWGEFRARRVDG